METEFTFPWAEAAIDRIYNSTNLPEAITTTAGYLTDIVDEFWRLNRVVDEDAEYLPFINENIAGLDDETPQMSRDLLEASREILKIYAMLPSMEEWEVEFEATQRLAPYLDPQIDRLEGVWVILGNMIAHHQGWVEGEASELTEALHEALHEELIMEKDWPIEFPEERPPDGREEFTNVGGD
ncbi:MAG: hypothetical protein ORN23_07180 [Chthoniobacterales bacterium]|nr:hypothetical protein [Chthoniobacterales bacterium]